MRLILIFTAASLSLGPAFAQSAAPTAPAPSPSSTSNASTTPSVNRPGDADVKSSNKNGGTGGQPSSGNGG